MRQCSNVAPWRSGDPQGAFRDIIARVGLVGLAGRRTESGPCLKRHHVPGGVRCLLLGVASSRLDSPECRILLLSLASNQKRGTHENDEPPVSCLRANQSLRGICQRHLKGDPHPETGQKPSRTPSEKPNRTPKSVKRQIGQKMDPIGFDPQPCLKHRLVTHLSSASELSHLFWFGPV